MTRMSSRWALVLVALGAALTAGIAGRHVPPAARTAEVRVIPPLSPPPAKPALVPGQPFLFTLADPATGRTPSYDYIRADGRPFPWGEAVLRVWTLQRMERHGQEPAVLWFAVEGGPGLVRLEQADPTPHNLPYLSPLVEDADLQRLRRRFEGKRVWAYGGGSAVCPETDRGNVSRIQWLATTPATIRRVYRIAAPFEMNRGPYVLYGAETASTFEAERPFVVLLTPPEKAYLHGYSRGNTSWSMGARDIRQLPDVSRPASYVAAFTLFGDAETLERTYSLSGPFDLHPEWSKNERAMVEGGALDLGMTKDMVAWSYGWPMIEGTPAELRRRNVWPYDSIGPYHLLVTFKGGRMDGIREDGTLP